MDAALCVAPAVPTRRPALDRLQLSAACGALVLLGFVTWRCCALGVHSLDSVAIGAALWGLLLLGLPCALAAGRDVRPAENRTTREVFAEVFPATGCSVVLRLAKAAFVYLRLALMCATVCANFRALPPFDLGHLTPVAKHVVTWYELPTVLFLLMLWALHWKNFCRRRDTEQDNVLITIYHLTTLPPTLAAFSMFQAVKYANLGRAMSDVQRAARTGRCKTLFVVFKILLFAALGVLATIAKIAQLDFVQGKSSQWQQWTMREWLILAGFVNSVAGLLPDRTRDGIEAVLMVDEMDDRADVRDHAESWMKGLLEALLREHPGARGIHWSAVCLQTLTFDEFRRLYRQGREEAP